MKLTLVLIFSTLAFGQQVFQVTAAQGDGSTCTGTQNAGANVNLTITCAAIYQGKPTGVYHIFEGGSAQVRVPVSHTVQFGDVLCMFGDNPTNFAVSINNFASIPAHSAAYNCVINIRTAGIVTSNASGPNGVVTWTTSTKRSFWSRLFRP